MIAASTNLTRGPRCAGWASAQLAPPRPRPGIGRRRPRPAGLGGRRTGPPSLPRPTAPGGHPAVFGLRFPGGGPDTLCGPSSPPRQVFSNPGRPIVTPQTPTGDRRSESGSETGLDDLQLARRAVEGDLEARERLAAKLRCIPRFVSERNRRLGSPLTVEGVEEVSQNVILEVWKKLDRFEGRARLETWTYAFCRNETMNAARRIQRERSRTTSLTGLDSDHDPAVTISVDRGLLDEETEALLAHLAPRETEVVRMRHFEDLALPEIALRLGLSVSSVKTHYYRGLAKLRTLLEPDGQEDRS